VSDHEGDWRDVEQGRSRAADRAPNAVQKPTAVIQTSREGDYPSGDATMWGGTADLTRTIPDDSGIVELKTPQVCRAQVADNRPRVWSWMLQVDLTTTNGDIVLGGIPKLEWTMGVGLATLQVVQDLQLLIVASGNLWLPITGSKFSQFTVRAAHLAHASAGESFTDPRPIGENVGARLIVPVLNGGSAPDTIRIAARMFICPEHTTP
jgi:hypothetical protein